MHSTKIEEFKLTIPTYEDCPAEELPMFAENRVHQRTSGRPYPSAVVLEVQREKKVLREYTAVLLENEYLEVVVLPELGGRIYCAKDKRTGYDFFYKQHVIKPALIGCLGSWVSGGLEFNWPFHHRPSTFMPVDYVLEQDGDGSVTVWLSEHDPMERMKGMVGVTLRPGCAVLETRMKLCNRTPYTRSFLWWENAAVPVNPDYRIFFPPDVTYAHFHYKRSVSSFPIGEGVFNGISMKHHPDISKHGNTIQPTSYFSAPSKYDFFGGYDEGIGRGVVHVADHNISIGKKMFTWGYNQLSQSWERALTDTDGAYAELMAGSYSDNQPDFAWLAPYEEKCFSQLWYPISDIGVPQYANEKGAMRIEGGEVSVYTTRDILGASITIAAGGRILLTGRTDFAAGITQRFAVQADDFLTVTVTGANGKAILGFTEFKADSSNIPDTTQDIPDFPDMKTADELYLAGVHVDQYRDPIAYPDAYWKEALQRNPGHYMSLTAMGEYKIKQNNPAEALVYLEQALKRLTSHNKHPRCGEAYYQYGLALRMTGKPEEAYDAFFKAAWDAGCVCRAMTQLTALDGLFSNFEKMAEHAVWALKYGGNNPVASVYHSLAEWKLGNDALAAELLRKILANDPLNHLARFALCLVTDCFEGFYQAFKSDISSACLDIYYDLTNAGFFEEGKNLLDGLAAAQSELLPLVYFHLALITKDETFLHMAAKAPAGRIFPSRFEDKKILKAVTEQYPDNAGAWYLLGCLYYSCRQYIQAENCFIAVLELDEKNYAAMRNLAALYYSHLNRKTDTLKLLKTAFSLAPDNKQLVFEISYVMGKLDIDVKEHIAFLKSNPFALKRDDVVLELAKAYNRAAEHDKALEVLLSHHFIPCEGGEHSVADQYMAAHLGIGLRHMEHHAFSEAAVSFAKACELPDHLGAGLWHEAKMVPHKFYMAQCWLKTGQTAQANEIFEYIIDLAVDYFSDMHLPELIYYQAMSLRYLGREPDADVLISSFCRKTGILEKRKDPGYFKATPFFLSYVDDPETERGGYCGYLNGFVKKYKEAWLNS
jgi:tetratricopeptide (TPR) repeat protein